MDPTTSLFVTSFSALDWCIVGVYLAAMAALGVYVQRHVHGSDDYLVAGRGSGTALSVATYVGTSLGLVTVMYASQAGFQNGFSYFYIGMLDFLVGILIGGTGVVVAGFRRLKLTTLPEFFERRYSSEVRILAGTMAVIAGVLNMGLFPKMAGMFLTYVTGLRAMVDDEQAELLVNGITSLLIVVVIIYTVSGGMVSVAVTDYVQFVLLSFSMGIGLWYCLGATELGWNGVVEAVYTHRGEAAFNPLSLTSPHYGPVWAIFNIFVAASAALCWSPEATRGLTTTDAKTTSRTFLFGSPGSFVKTAIPGLWGIVAFAFLTQSATLGAYFSPEAVAQNDDRSLQAMPMLMGTLLPTGVLGLLVAGLLAAMMSTHSSYFITWAAISTNDIVGPVAERMRGRRMYSWEIILATRAMVVLIGLFLLIWGIWYETPSDVWAYMTVTGTIYLSGSSVAVVGGMYWKRASTTGAFLAFLTGMLAVVGVFARPLTKWLVPGGEPERIAQVQTWLNENTIGLTTFLACITVFILGSLLFPDKEPKDLTLQLHGESA